MIWLVDTSVWIDFLRGRETQLVSQLQQLLAPDNATAITPVIYQEILQGTDSEENFKRYEEYFGSQLFVHPRHPVQSYAKAAWLYFHCRKNGITLRSTIDCLIAQIAIEHNLFLLHDDRDFTQIASVEPRLRLAESLWK